MNFFIADAWAQGGPPPGAPGDFWVPLLIFSTIFLVYYLLAIRPRLKRHKERLRMLASVNKGDEIITNGGLLGRILQVGDNFLLLELSEGMEVKVEKSAVSRVVPKGTAKSL
ncbi:preprotein translocase subunit YajC [Nitrosococcus oceani]|uniref:Sec translocon accessory complex subunit YajC n=2 Tax=Nitrosococcus oceani TaxID=1229 RepID=Q3JBW5_NITOC|nr:preprotein translocase subunit YajC [Nitrosococcus oceani]ABA57681.1 protein translocase subunit yajC [Nitrosococcus oceani ATCC 19707]EDZ66992.1 preprotein translocase, YajC subunit [Nitrosococcus oceani AFC27]KFI19969.1 preprotein translocase subunit YidC [Nitrosococcus oceani C-27]KFI23126.1 preprotein translocase subunit YidC [Nitrosococcus oceani]